MSIGPENDLHASCNSQSSYQSAYFINVTVSRTTQDYLKS